MTNETSEPDFDDEIDDDIDDVDDEFGGYDDLDAALDAQFGSDDANALAEAERAMAEARERLSEVPAEIVITNHVMGLYELAAIHLSATPPDLRQAVLAIDAVACLVDGLGDRLGEEAPTLRDALNNIRLAFVQIKGQVTAAESTADPSSDVG